jgi:hypothetical protein
MRSAPRRSRFFWRAAQPAVTALINARFGEAGTAMSEQMLAAAEE